MLRGESLKSLPIVVTEGVVKIDPADLGGKKGTHSFCSLFFVLVSSVYPGL